MSTKYCFLGLNRLALMGPGFVQRQFSLSPLGSIPGYGKVYVSFKNNVAIIEYLMDKYAFVFATRGHCTKGKQYKCHYILKLKYGLVLKTIKLFCLLYPALWLQISRRSGGWEPWSRGNGRRLVFQWVRIPALCTGWTFFPFLCCKNCNVCLKDENRLKRACGWPIFKRRAGPLVRDTTTF